MVLFSHPSLSHEGSNFPSKIEIHQLLSGRDIATNVKENKLHYMAFQMANYAYLVVQKRRNGKQGRDAESSEKYEADVVIIDGGGWDVAGILKICKQNKWKVNYCLFSHRHFDHVGKSLWKSCHCFI